MLSTHCGPHCLEKSSKWCFLMASPCVWLKERCPQLTSWQNPPYDFISWSYMLWLSGVQTHHAHSTCHFFLSQPFTERAIQGFSSTNLVAFISLNSLKVTSVPLWRLRFDWLCLHCQKEAVCRTLQHTWLVKISASSFKLYFCLTSCPSAGEWLSHSQTPACAAVVFLRHGCQPVTVAGGANPVNLDYEQRCVPLTSIIYTSLAAWQKSNIALI